MLTFADGEVRSPPTIALIAFYLDWQRSPDLDEMEPRMGGSCELCGEVLWGDDEDLCSICVELGQREAA